MRKSTYRKKYKIRYSLNNKTNNFEVTFPPEVIEREARLRGITIFELIKGFRAIAQYNGHNNGVLYTIEKK
jgi:hypothetical protein